MAVKNIVLPIPLSSVASSTFLGAYLLLSATTGLPHPCIIIRIVNNSDTDATISYDGVNDHDFVPAMGSLNLEFQTNSQPQNQVCSLAQGTKIYVKGTVGIGLIYLAGYYQPQA